MNYCHEFSNFASCGEKYLKYVFEGTIAADLARKPTGQLIKCTTQSLKTYFLMRVTLQPVTAKKSIKFS